MSFTRKQFNHQYASGNGSISGAWTSALTSGSLIVVFVSGDSNTTAISDGVNTFSSMIGPANTTGSPNSVWVSAWYAINTSTGTPTISLTSGPNDIGFTAVEYTSSSGFPALASVL